MWFCPPLFAQYSTIAQPDKVAASAQEQLLTPLFHWHLDSTTSQLSDIQNLGNWQASLPLKRLSPQQSLWGKVTLEFPQSSNSTYFISINNPLLDYVDIYVLDDKSRILHSYLLGTKRPLSSNLLSHQMFVVPLNGGIQNHLDIYLRVRDDGPLSLPIYFSPEHQFNLMQQSQLLVLGLFVGGLLLLCGYFLSSYVVLRSPVRFWFAVSCGLYVLLVLNNQGLAGMLSTTSAYISNFNNLLFGLLAIAVAKVVFALTEKVPMHWRYSCYAMGFVLMASALLPSSYEHLQLALYLGLLLCTSLVVLLWRYRQPDKTLCNILLLVALLGCALLNGFEFAQLLQAQALDVRLKLLPHLGNIGVILCASLAIAGHERSMARRQLQVLRTSIEHLQHFHELFQHSAQGLYISALNGQLLHINQAMCNIFGYDEPESMLSQISNAGQLYAEPADREVLLGELQQNGKVLGKELRGLRRDGKPFWFAISAQVKQLHDQKLLFGAVIDVDERKQAELSLAFFASHDPLSGAYNRHEFENQLHSAYAEATQQHSDITLLYLGIEQLHAVNEHCGHKAGDLLIKQLAQKLNEVAYERGILGRLNDNDFALLLQGEQAQMAYMLANQLLDSAKAFRFVWEKRIFSIGLSIGQVSCQPDIHSAEQLIQLADSACQIAKQHGPYHIHTYSQTDSQTYPAAIPDDPSAGIAEALANDQFELYYQHYQSLKKHDGMHYYEVLLRMRDASGQLIAPMSFLPDAERYNLSCHIDRWVVERYFSWLADHPDHLEMLGRCNINLSFNSIIDKDFKLFILHAFEKYAVPHAKICFELGENAGLIKNELVIDFIQTFHHLGCHFALDDFGSGFATYRYLKQLPFDMVKIDGRFIKEILLDRSDMAIVSSINQVAKAMGMETVAEFVESSEVLVELGKLGVDYAQGYSLDKPSPLQQFKSLN